MGTSGSGHGAGRWLDSVVLWFCVVIVQASDNAAVAATELIVPLSDTRIQVAGQIMVERATHTVQIPALVNQRSGLVEYLLVHTSGKRHEALFTTSVEPQHLHLACLLAGGPETGGTPQPVAVTITWQGHGPVKRATPEDLLAPATHDGVPIADEITASARWSYHGSHFAADGFAAQRTGNAIALQADASALMQAPGLQAREFVPMTERLPPVATPITLIITFPPSASVPAQEIP